MILKAYSLLDTKTGVFSAPMYFVHEGQAMRAVIEIGLDYSTQVARYPEDFVLFLVGEFDDCVGVVTCTGPVNMGPVVQLLPKRRPVADVSLSETVEG